MRTRPYPLEVQEEAITRIRRGETLTAVRKVLHCDEQQLRRDLAKYPDFQRRMDANSRHVHTAQPKKRQKGWYVQKVQRTRARDDSPTRLSDHQIAALKGRRITDLQQLAVIKARIEGYITTRRCRWTSLDGHPRESGEAR